MVSTLWEEALILHSLTRKSGLEGYAKKTLASAGRDRNGDAVVLRVSEGFPWAAGNFNGGLDPVRRHSRFTLPGQHDVLLHSADL